MNAIPRRQFLQTSTVAGLSSAALLSGLARAAAAVPPSRKMTLNLVCGNIGISVSQTQAIDLAARFGFESVEAYGGYLASQSESQVKELLATMKEKGISFGAAGLPVDFRGDDRRFADGSSGLPKFAAGLQRAGVGRVGTWISPGHNTLTYRQNFQQHTERLQQVAQVLKDSDVRLGLEYVGTKTSRDRVRFPFIHTMVEMKELIAEIGTGNVGFILDAWHWWQAGESAADILTLKGEQVIAVDLNDAPAGVPKEQQLDGKRELPMATGVIDTSAFLNALNQIGYAGPVRAEPFNKPLTELANDDRCAAVAQAMKKAFALIQ